MRRKRKMKLELTIDFSRLLGAVQDIFKQVRITHFLLLLFAAHMIQISFPSDGSYVFDEAHYVPASLAALRGVDTNPAHPPLPKLIGAVAIALLGNDWFAWRFPQVLMQIAVLCLFYLIARRFLGDPWALGAAMLLGLDTLFFIHGGILLLDMTGFLFGLLAFELYFRGRYALSAAAMGIAFLSRIMAIFLFATLAIYHVYSNRRDLKHAVRIGARYTVIALIVFGLLLSAYDAVYKPPSFTAVTNYVITNVVNDDSGTPVATVTTTSQSVGPGGPMTNAVEHVLFIMRYHGPGGIVINEPYRPYQYAWNWVIPGFSPADFPTYYRVDVTVTSPEGTAHHVPIWYIAALNPAVVCGFWPTIIALAAALWRRRSTETAVMVGAGILCNYSPWLVMSLVVRRIGFNYYMIWPLPFIALGLAFAWKTLLGEENGKLVLAFNVVWALGFFLKFFPVRPFP